MATSIPLGYPLWMDGMQWSFLLQRQIGGGVAVWDTNASAAAANPLGGVFHGPAKPLAAGPQATPNMTVLINAGYCALTHPTPGHGAYLFGLLAQGSLNIAANSSGAVRIDLIVARVYDTGNSSASCDIEPVTGTPGSGQPATPAAAILLATVTVPSGAASITTSNITDKRTFTVAPGGILPATTANTPPLAPGQLLWNLSGSGLEALTPAVTYTQTFPTSTSWISPFTGYVYAAGIGGDGGGGGGYQDYGNENHSNQAGAAGGGAEWAADWIHVTKGNSYPVEIGQGGYRGSGGTNSSGTATLGADGSDGTATTFVGDSSQTLTCNPGKGGEGGGTHFPNAGGEGGTGSTNAYHQPGGQGGSGATGSSAAGGGGGASGSPGAPGAPGGNASGRTPGAGGIAGPGGANGAPGGKPSTNGADGLIPGGGAGGGGADTETYYQAGGNGSDGQLQLTWVITPASVTPVFTVDSAVDDLATVDTSTGTAGSSGLTAGSGSSYGWGIGYGSTTSNNGDFGIYSQYYGTGSADGQSVNQIQVSFDADGSTDFAIDAKWQLAVPEAAVGLNSPSIPHGQCRIIVLIDNTIIDQVYLCCSASGGVTRPGDGGSFTAYTSGQRGTTPAAGTHTATLAVETMNTLSGQYSGAHVGNLASVGTSPKPFGAALPSGFTAALTQENCSLRVAGIPAATQ